VGLGFSWARRVLVTDLKVALVLLMVVLLGVLIDAVNLHGEAEDVNVTTREDFIAGQVVISNEGLSRLLNLTGVGQLLSSEEAGERVKSVILVMGFTDLNSVVSQIVVDDKRSVLVGAVESEDLSVVVQELLLRGYLTASKLLLEVLEHESITLGCNWDLLFVEGVSGAFLSNSARLTTFHEEFSSVVIAVVDAEDAAVDSDVKSNSEVVGHEGLLGAVTLEDHVAVKERSLGNTRVHLLGLGDHDGLVFQVVEDDGLADSVVFKSAFNDTLFGVCVESQYLFV